MLYNIFNVADFMHALSLFFSCADVTNELRTSALKNTADSAERNGRTVTFREIHQPITRRSRSA